RINAQYSIRLSFEDVFDFPTLEKMANYINKVCNTEQKVYKIWRDVLKQDDLGYDDNFFELGGHSLIANQVINRIRSRFHAEINFDDFFKYPTIRLLSEYLDSLSSRRRPLPETSIPVLPVRKSYEVSHAQKRLWVLSQTAAGAMAYNQPGLYEI